MQHISIKQYFIIFLSDNSDVASLFRHPKHIPIYYEEIEPHIIFNYIDVITTTIKIHATVLNRNINMTTVAMLLVEILTLSKTERFLPSLKGI